MLQIKELNRMGAKKLVEVGISETMACNVGQNNAFRRKQLKKYRYLAYQSTANTQITYRDLYMDATFSKRESSLWDVTLLNQLDT